MSALALDVRPKIAAALRDGRAVVALESTLIAHGLPWPDNLGVAREAEKAIRDAGAEPATIAVLAGKPTIGLDDAELENLARARDVRKASRRDLAAAVTLSQTAATTVSATMALAHLAGIRVFATGGIGGAHRMTGEEPFLTTRTSSLASLFDVSSDLTELSRTPVAVICAGAKSILDIPRTLEFLETLGVPVVGYGCDEFPGFYLCSTGDAVSVRIDTPRQAASLLANHWELGGRGVVLAQPVELAFALDPAEFDLALAEAERMAQQASTRGPDVTPFLLARIAELTGGKSLRANRELIVANARLAAEIAKALG